MAWPLPPLLQMISLSLSFLLVILSHPGIPDYKSVKCVVFVAAFIFVDILHKPNIPNSRRCETKANHDIKFQTLQKRQLSLWNTSPLVFAEMTFSSQIYLFRLCLCWCKLSWYTSPDNWRGFRSAPVTALFSCGWRNGTFRFLLLCTLSFSQFNTCDQIEITNQLPLRKIRCKHFLFFSKCHEAVTAEICLQFVQTSID